MSFFDLFDLSFFRNTGAVAGVFVLVGLAAASILLFIFFAVRRRRRTQRLEHDTAVSATLAAAGFQRAPLDDEDDPGNNTGGSRSSFPNMEMKRSTLSSVPSGGRTSAYLDNPISEEGGPDHYNPYVDYVVPGGNDHVLAAGAYAAGTYDSNRTTSPPPVAFNNSHNKISHSASHSAGSYEPLLASFRHAEEPSSPLPGPTPPTPPPRNPARISDAQPPPPAFSERSSPNPYQPGSTPLTPRSAASSMYSSESTGDDRLDPGLRHRLKDETQTAFAGDLRDDEDYSRPVLGVRTFTFAVTSSC